MCLFLYSIRKLNAVDRLGLIDVYVMCVIEMWWVGALLIIDAL